MTIHRSTLRMLRYLASSALCSAALLGMGPFESTAHAVDPVTGIFVGTGGVFHAVPSASGVGWVLIGPGWATEVTAVVVNGTSYTGAAITVEVLEAEGALVALGQTVSTGGAATAATGGTTAAGTAAAGIGSTLVLIGGVIVVTTAAVIAYDCYSAGECLWTTVSNAGGWGVVLGTSPNPAAQPIPGAATVSCSDPAPLTSQCQGALGNVITDYYSWFGGSYWTCGEIWADTNVNSPEEQAALNSCNQQMNACVINTQAVCNANGMPRAAAEAVSTHAV